MEGGQILLQSGATFHGGRYEIVRCMNAGAMGAIYEVIQIGTKRRRALKVMLPSLVADEDLRSRFKQEATVTAEIDSEHIVETIDADVDGETGAPFLVMELLKGEDLGRVLDTEIRLQATEVVALLAQAAVGLDKTHAKGIVHRDLKPENLFLTRREDGSSRLKILDFGVAKVMVTGEAVKGTLTLGTPLYMSPEQIQGSGAIGAPADLYALGHIAFTLLSGEAYWEKAARGVTSMYALLTQVLEGLPEPATARAAALGATLPTAFDAWFDRAIANDPASRFRTAAELVRELATALGVPAPSLVAAGGEAGRGVASSAALTAALAPIEPPVEARRSPSPIMIGAILALAVAVAVFVVLWAIARKPPEGGVRAEPTTPSAAPAVTAPASAPIVTPAPQPVASAAPEPTTPPPAVTPAASATAPKPPRPPATAKPAATGTPMIPF